MGADINVFPISILGLDREKGNCTLHTHTIRNTHTHTTHTHHTHTHTHHTHTHTHHTHHTHPTHTTHTHTHTNVFLMTALQTFRKAHSKIR